MHLKPPVFARSGVFLVFEWWEWLSGHQIALCAVLSGLGLVCFLPWLFAFCSLVAVSQSVSEIVLIDDSLVKMDAL